MMSESKLIRNFCFTHDRWTLINIGKYGITPQIKYVHIFLCTADYVFSPLSAIPQPVSSSQL